MVTVRRLLKFMLPAAIIAAAATAVWQNQAILDWWRLRGYDPPAAIASLAENDAMTGDAKHIFYVNHPELMPQAVEFRQACTRSEQTIVLGCYHPGQSGIFIYDVSDARLDGVEQVTAAHEMLHAAYERLAGEDKKVVDRLLNDFYRSGLTDERVKNVIELYRTTEPEALTNEMHSVFGTEIPVGSLPAELENYYKRYFSDRSRVISYSAKYEAEFTNRLSQINDYDRQLSELKQKIDSAEASLASQSAQLEASRAQLDAYRDSADIAAYNAAVPGFNAKVKAYNKAVTLLKADIAAYNELVITRNTLAAEVRALESAIDTRITTQATE